MAMLAAAVHRLRRPVTALLVAAVALAATVTVASWPRPVDGTPTAGLTAGGMGSGQAAATVATVAPSTAPPQATDPPSAVVPTSSPAPTAAPTAPTFSRPELGGSLQKRLDTLRAKYAIPGVSVTIILRDGSAWTGTSGLADVRRTVPVEPDTAFAIASVSKTYTAALILALADEGALDLDARVSALLPDVKIAGKATVRQLLDHTSGLPDFFLNGKIDKALFGDPSRAWTTRDVFRYVGKPIFGAGKGWYYSNTNYHLLGLVAEAVGGAPFADQLRTRFFDPLGFAHTYAQVAEEPRGPVAHGYRVSGSAAKPTNRDLSDGTGVVPFTSVVTAAGAAGSLAASSPDVARWARALYTGDVLAPATVKAMIADAKRTARFRPRVPYGLGVQLVPLDGRRAYGHSGRLAGFRSIVRHLPREGITIAVLTNEATRDPSLIARSLLRMVSPTPTPTPPSSATP